MKKIAVIFILLFAMVLGGANAEPNQGIAVECDNGASFENGIKVTVIQMRSGFNYTATAIGIDDFDPVLAVLDEDGRGLCSDNTADADYYQALLPTTGEVEPSDNTAQVVFAQRSREAFADVSLVVGEAEDNEGEFVLILEGMAATEADGAGDIYSVQLTPNLINSGVPLSVYMISVTTALDPLMYIPNSDNVREAVEDNDGDPMLCDDSGNENSCWGESENLSDSGVSRTNNRSLAGGGLDAMLSLDIEGLELPDDDEDYFYYFVATSYQQTTFGDYVMVFHLGSGEEESGNRRRSGGDK
ncbi:MAG: hypothetical protein MUF87_11665 [Anaerolineae bacterium]|jgi:hypothetical protein|nr:hypothetical protein [Anaerolineae bacterium]